MQKFKIQNVFASFSLGLPIDIESLSKEFTKSIYDPQLSPPLEIRDEEYCLVFRVFDTGQVTCIGGKSTKDVKASVRKFLQVLRSKKYIRSTNVRLKISNYVVTSSLGKKIRIWKAAYFLEGSKYTPQKQPWLTYELDKSRVVFHIFENGNIVCVGCKNRKEMDLSFKALRTRLDESNLL